MVMNILNNLTKRVNNYEISIYFRDVTPQLASEILASNNTKNRKILPSHVTALAKNMSEGTWRFNGDTIRFDATGTLIDGQHRLMAIVKSGCTIPCLFVVGLAPDTIKCIDIEMKPRNLKNLLEMDFVKNAGVKATTIRRLFSLKNGLVALSSNNGGLDGKSSSMIATMDTKYNYYYDNEDIIKDVVAMAASLYKKTKLMPTADIAAMGLLLINELGYHYDLVKDFLEGIILNSPIPLLSDVHYILVKDSNATKKMTGVYKQSLIAKAWNYFSTGKLVKRVAYNPTRDGIVKFQ